MNEHPSAPAPPSTAAPEKPVAQPRATGSITSCTYPLVSALVAAEEELGHGRLWLPVSTAGELTVRRELAERQRRFSELFELCRDEAGGIREIESVASRSAGPINTFLRARGFGIELQPLGRNEFGVASALSLLVEWPSLGERGTLRTPAGKAYPSVLLTSGVSVWARAGHREPVVTIETKSGDVVWMTVLDRPAPDADLVALGLDISEHVERAYQFEGVAFPMVDLDQLVDISWLLGLSTYDRSNAPAVITQALQQTRLRMNEHGARVESAAAMGVLRMAMPPKPRPPVVVDRPFLCWVTRGLSQPLFVGWIDEADWKDPGTL